MHRTKDESKSQSVQIHQLSPSERELPPLLNPLPKGEAINFLLLDKNFSDVYYKIYQFFFLTL